MKFKFIIISVLCSLSLMTQAQDWSSDVYKYGEEYPGYIIDEKGNKTEGFITYQNRYSMQNEVIFFKDKNDKKSKEKFKTADLKEYKVADKVYHCIHYSGGLLPKPVRANLLVSEGCINQYVWYDRAENYMLMQQGSNESEEEFMNRMYPSKMVFQRKGSDEPKSVDYFAIKFPVKMSEWVADNATIADKVKNKEKGYGVLRILEIIDEYNAQCK